MIASLPLYQQKIDKLDKRRASRDSGHKMFGRRSSGLTGLNGGEEGNDAPEIRRSSVTSAGSSRRKSKTPRVYQTLITSTSKLPMALTPEDNAMLITVPIPLSSLRLPNEVGVRPMPNSSWVAKLAGPFTSKSKPNQTDTNPFGVKHVVMTREDYVRYWARDDEGKYVGLEEESVGRELWRKKLWGELGLKMSPNTGVDVREKTGGRQIVDGRINAGPPPV